LREAGGDLTVMIVGPGAVTAVLSPLLNDAARPSGRLRRLIGDAARYADQLLRRVPCLPLRSLEPVEVEEVLTKPHRLVVVDRSSRVLAAVTRQLPGAECHRVDIVTTTPPVQADVVIAFNVICRLLDPAAGVRHLLPVVRPGGWLLMDDRSAQAHLLPAAVEFTLVASKTYRRDSALATG